MKIKESIREDFEHGKKINDNPYGSGVYKYLERWADMLEEKMKETGKPMPEVIEEYADQLSHDADTEGITGFMYGCAVSILSQAWEYGEDLRKWHNKQYGYSGDGCVNPAIMTIG